MAVMSDCHSALLAQAYQWLLWVSDGHLRSQSAACDESFYFNCINRSAKSAIYSECFRQDDVVKRLANVPRISTLTLQKI